MKTYEINGRFFTIGQKITIQYFDETVKGTLLSVTESKKDWFLSIKTGKATKLVQIYKSRL